MIDIEASINGFHNPRKHKNLTAEQFLLKYLRRQAKLVKRGNSKADIRAGMIIIILFDWYKWIEHVKKRFPRTLQLNETKS